MQAAWLITKDHSEYTVAVTNNRRFCTVLWIFLSPGYYGIRWTLAIYKSSIPVNDNTLQILNGYTICKSCHKMVIYPGIEIFIVEKPFEHFVISYMWSDEVWEYFTFSENLT